MISPPISEHLLASNAAETASIPECGHALILDGVAHSMAESGAARPVLAPLTRRFSPGQFHVVGGPSGAGKTTLLSILSLSVRPTSGRVRWGTDDLTRLAPVDQARWRRQHLGLIFQTSRLVSVMTVAEHIKLAAAIRDQPEAEAEGLALLTALGMAEQLGQLPAQLSGGEKQRVAIAQALCARPSILLADEPTAALDNTNAALVATTLQTFARENSAVVICVSHDRVVMDVADDLLMLEKP
jgi:ABC-type lipoprotein export system ATPase subunit